MCAVVFVHGETEYQFVKKLKYALRLNIDIIKDTTSIQVNGLINKMESKFRLSKYRNDGKLDVKKGKVCNEFKIFTVMDLDDCTPQVAEAYKNGHLFDDYEYKEYVTPIYDIPNFEEAFYKGKIIKSIPSKSEKLKTVENIFPPNDERPSFEFIEELKNKLKKCNFTNLDIMIDYFLEEAKKNHYIKNATIRH